jgi:hypothetical protein
MSADRKTSNYKLRWTYMGFTRLGGMAFQTPWAEIATVHHLSAATAVPPPRYAGTTTRDVMQVARYLTRALRTAPEFAAALYSDAFLVSPKTWPDDMLRLFPTDDPPSPHDFATYILSRRGGAGKAGPGADVLSKMVLCWWLVGLPLAALDARATLPLPAASHLYDAVKSLMQRPVFSLWALGDDLAPLMDSDQMVKSLPYILGLKRGTTADTRVYSGALHDAVNGPYVTAIRSRRTAIRPMKRILPDLPATFISLEEKQSTLMSNPTFGDALIENRKVVEKALESWIFPDYASFTPLDVAWSTK